MGLRGIAALMVVGYHLQYSAGYLLPIERSGLFRRGYLGVDLFFIMSGFIISYVNDQAGRPVTTRAGALAFWGARLARIYPLLAVTLAAMVALAGFEWVIHGISRGDWALPDRFEAGSLAILASQALLVNAWIPDFVGWNEPSWSISAEIFAYLLFPLLLAAVRRAPLASRLTMMTGASAFYVAVAITHRDLTIINGAAPFRGLAGFMLGMVLYQERDAWTALSSRLLGLQQVLGLALVGLVLARPGWDPFVVPGLMLLIGAAWPDRGIVARVLAIRPLQWLGTISYSIYLNHFLVIEAVGLVWAKVEPRLPFDELVSHLLWLGLVYAILLVLSHLTFRLVERPARRWASAYLSARRAGPIALSPAAP